MRTVPLAAVASVRVSNVDKNTVEGDLPVALCNYTDVYYNPAITAQIAFMTATATAEQVQRFGIQCDDILVTKDSETADDIGISAQVVGDLPDVVCGYHLAMIRPDRSRIEPRFLFWSIASRATRSYFAVEATGVTRFGLRTSSLRKTPVPVPVVETQRRTADFLDRETARIDAMLRATDALDLLDAAFKHELQHRVDGLAGDARVGRVRHVLRKITQGWSPQCDERPAESGEVGVLKAGAVNGGRFRPDQNKRLPPETPPRLEHLVRMGDLLMSRASGSLDLIGSTAIVPALADVQLLLCDKLYRLDVDERAVDPRYLMFVLQSPRTRDIIKLGTSGAGGLANNLPASVIRQIPLHIPPLQDQREFVDWCESRRRAIDRVGHELVSFRALLRGYRESLITEAVTGQLDIGRMSERQMEERLAAASEGVRL